MRSQEIVALLLSVWLAPPAAAAPQDEPVLGKRSPILAVDADTETLRLEAGARLRQRPDRSATLLEVLAESAELPILDRRGPWVKVRYGTWLAWVVPGGERPAAGRLLPARSAPDEARLLRARDLLGTPPEPSALAEFTLYTDVADEALLRRLGRVAAELPTTYRERYGLEPGPQTGATVVLFASEASYRRFEEADPQLSTSETGGYTSNGLSILFVGERSPEETVQILVHELTHLLNRGALGSATPTWLEEGMAEDLAFSRVEADGKIQVGSLGGFSTAGLKDLGPAGVLHRSESGGARRALVALLAAWNEPVRPSLAALPTLPRQRFMDASARALHYAQSAFLIRYLLDGGSRELERGFLSYLDEVALADLPVGVSLWPLLRTDPETVERGLYRWLRRRAQADGLPLPDRGPR